MPGPNRQRALNLSDVPNMQVEPDGNLKIKLGRDGQVIPPPFPAPVGMCVLYMGPAANIGVGEWLGWQIVTDLTDLYLKTAVDDNDVGSTGGSATVAINHGHTVTVANTGTLTVENNTRIQTVDQTASKNTDVADDTHNHDLLPHGHPGSTVSSYSGNVTVTPPFLKLYLVRYVGVTS